MEERNKSYQSKKCESCGSEFRCGARAADCWCSTLTLNEDLVGELRPQFADCLCPSCLAKAAEGCAQPGRR